MTTWWNKDNEVIRNWYQKHRRWHPLTGNLPHQFESGVPSYLDMQLLEIIYRCRGMWKEDPESLNLATALYRRVPEFLSSASTDDFPSPKFKPLSLCAIRLAWDALKGLYSGKLEKDTELWRSHDRAKSLFQQAFVSFLFSESERKKDEKIRKEFSEKGKATKKNPGILAATKEAFQKSKSKTADSVWDYLKKYRYEEEFECKIKHKLYRIFFDRDDPKLTCITSWRKGNKIVSEDKRIGKSAFRKNYFPEIRKKL